MSSKTDKLDLHPIIHRRPEPRVKRVTLTSIPTGIFPRQWIQIPLSDLKTSSSPSTPHLPPGCCRHGTVTIDMYYVFTCGELVM